MKKQNELIVGRSTVPLDTFSIIQKKSGRKWKMRTNILQSHF